MTKGHVHLVHPDRMEHTKGSVNICLVRHVGKELAMANRGMYRIDLVSSESAFGC